MKFLDITPEAIILEYCGGKYKVSYQFFIYDYVFCRLLVKDWITSISEDGYLLNYTRRFKSKPIGLFKFDDMNGDFICASWDTNYIVRRSFDFDPEMYFFVLLRQG